MNEIERKFKENDEKESEKQKQRSGKRGLHAEEVSGTAHVASEAGSDRTAALEEVFAKALTVDKGVRLFMDKEEAIEQDAAAALQGWGENEGEGGGEMPSIDDIALVCSRLGFIWLFFIISFRSLDLHKYIYAHIYFLNCCVIWVVCFLIVMIFLIFFCSESR